MSSISSSANSTLGIILVSVSNTTYYCSENFTQHRKQHDVDVVQSYLSRLVGYISCYHRRLEFFPLKAWINADCVYWCLQRWMNCGIKWRLFTFKLFGVIRSYSSHLHPTHLGKNRPKSIHTSIIYTYGNAATNVRATPSEHWLCHALSTSCRNHVTALQEKPADCWPS